MPKTQIKFSHIEEAFEVKYEAAFDFNNFIFESLRNGEALDPTKIGNMYLQILNLRLADLDGEIEELDDAGADYYAA